MRLILKNMYSYQLPTMTKNPRCATPAIDSIYAEWKQNPNPYDDPRYLIPTCQRDKIAAENPSKTKKCATPAMNVVLRLEPEFERLITAEVTEEPILESFKKLT